MVTYITAVEVSRHTTETSTVFVGLKSGQVKKITNANNNPGYTITTLYNQAGSVSDIHIGSSEDELFVTYYNYGLNTGVTLYSLHRTMGFQLHASKEGNFPDIPVYSDSKQSI